jgi:DNA-binding XRE family transcriptional regulator
MEFLSPKRPRYRFFSKLRAFANFASSSKYLPIYPHIWVLYPVVLYSSMSNHLQMAKPSPKHAGNPVLMSLGKTIRSLRAERKISQETLAYGADLDRSYMGGIERGEHNFTILSLMKVAVQLDLKVSELFKKAGL